MGARYPKHLVQGRLGGSVSGKAILHLSKVGDRARVARHEDNGPNRDVRLKQLLSRDDGTDCVGV